MRIRNPETAALPFLILSMAVFLSAGFFHLGKFETTDEHLWKYGRIAQYWRSLGQGDLLGTYINDKPGVTVALISGIGLLSEPHPEDGERLALASPEESRLFERYDAAQTEATNRIFRLPVLLFATLSIAAIFLLVRAATGSPVSALFSSMLMATSPILIGMSQIINPDSFFWIFGTLAPLSFLAWIRSDRRLFLILAGVFLGFALLSKYTGFSLFLLFVLAAAAEAVFLKKDGAALPVLLRRISGIAAIAAIAAGIFSLFLPATLIRPEYLLKGISQFFTPAAIAMAAVGAAGLAAAVWFLRPAIERSLAAAAAKKSLVFSAVSGAFLLLFALSVANVWTNQSFSPIEALRDASYANEPNNFSFKPVMDRRSVPLIESQPKLYLMEAAPIVFSLSLPAILLLSSLAFPSVRKALTDREKAAITSILLFSLLYLAAALSAKVVTNARYLIILYPLLSIAAGITFQRIILAKEGAPGRLFIAASSSLLIAGAATLWHIKPFFFSYSNILLPKTVSIHDSWGHGSYEAAQYLNALPEPESIVIWSNSDTVCRFFAGKCLRSRKIDLSLAQPDFFVLSKRGVLKERNRFILENGPSPEKDAGYYIGKSETSSVWQLRIGGRPDNFIRIIPYEP